MRAKNALRGSVLLTAATAMVAAGTVSVAGAKTVTWNYDFTDPTYGNAGWQLLNTPPGDETQGDWYRSTFTPGTGLRIEPTGNNGAIYNDKLGVWWLYAPAGSSVKRVRVDHLNGKSFAGQIGRVWLAGLKPDPLPRPAAVSREIRDSGATWDDDTITLQPPVDTSAQGFGLWLYPRPCDVAVAGDCNPANPADGAYVNVGKLSMVIDDPSTPDIDVEGIDQGTLWTNRRDVALNAKVDDPQTGIAEVTAEVRTPMGTKNLTLGSWKPDVKNVKKRQYAQPQLQGDQQVTRSVAVPTQGRTTIVVRTKNGAGMSSTKRGTVRVDRQKPQITWPKTVKPGSKVRISDELSGVSRATLTIDGRVQDQCQGGSRSCSLKVPSDTAGRSTVAVRVSDQADNTQTANRTTPAGPKAKTPGRKKKPLPTPGLGVSVRGPSDGKVSVYATPNGLEIGQPGDTTPLDPVVLATGATNAKGKVTFQPNLSDPRVQQIANENQGLVNAVVIGSGPNGVALENTIWFVPPTDGIGTASLIKKIGQDIGPPIARPLKSRPLIGGQLPVEDAWIAPKVTLDMRKTSERMVNRDTSDVDPSPGGIIKAKSGLIKAQSGKSGGEDVTDDNPPSPKRITCEDFHDTFGNVKVYRYPARRSKGGNQMKVSVPVGQVQTVPGVNYSISLAERRLATTGSAIEFSGKGVSIGGKVSLTRNSGKGAERELSDASLRRDLYTQIYLSDYRWSVQCPEGRKIFHVVQPDIWEGRVYESAKKLSQVACYPRYTKTSQGVPYSYRDTLKNDEGVTYDREGETKLEYKGLSVGFNTKASWGENLSQTMKFDNKGSGYYWVCTPTQNEAPVGSPTWWATKATVRQIRAAGKKL